MLLYVDSDSLALLAYGAQVPIRSLFSGGNSFLRKNGGATISFPTSVGIGAKGNSGVASEISSTSGAIGYMSASYLIAQKITAAQIQNAKGNYEYPNLSNIEDAASEVTSVPAGNALHITDPPKRYKKAYPISTFTYALVPQSGNPQASLLKQWFTYCVTTSTSPEHTSVALMENAAVAP